MTITMLSPRSQTASSRISWAMRMGLAIRLDREPPSIRATGDDSPGEVNHTLRPSATISKTAYPRDSSPPSAPHITHTDIARARTEFALVPSCSTTQRPTVASRCIYARQHEDQREPRGGRRPAATTLITAAAVAAMQLARTVRRDEAFGGRFKTTPRVCFYSHLAHVRDVPWRPHDHDMNLWRLRLAGTPRRTARISP